MTIFEDYNLKQFDNLELLAKQVVEGFIIGLHKSPFHGFSVEFAEHRLYNEGESTKDIDWKVYARTDKMFIKKFEEETNLRCQMVIDISSSMYFPADKSFNKLKFSALSSAALMNLLRRQRDAFGLSVFADKLYENTRCKSSNTHYQYLLSILDGVLKDNKNNRPTAAAENLHILADSLHKRSLVIIFSDMFENMAESKELFDALQHLRYAKHEVILFHTVDKSLEIDFNYENRPYLFIDMESGEEIRLQSDQVKETYRSKINEYYNELKMKCLQYKIDFVEADINQGFDQILQSYLVKRAKIKSK